VVVHLREASMQQELQDRKKLQEQLQDRVEAMVIWAGEVADLRVTGTNNEATIAKHVAVQVVVVLHEASLKQQLKEHKELLLP
jgi:hypothetical protein